MYTLLLLTWDWGRDALGLGILGELHNMCSIIWKEVWQELMEFRKCATEELSSFGTTQGRGLFLFLHILNEIWWYIEILKQLIIFLGR